MKNELGCSKKNPPRCMVSGIKVKMIKDANGNPKGNRVVCGHLLPCKSDLNKLKTLSVSANELNEPKNCVFWTQGIKDCYERLRISFIKSLKSPLQECYVLKIWDDTARNVCMFPG